jgi:hypothetical protein
LLEKRFGELGAVGEHPFVMRRSGDAIEDDLSRIERDGSIDHFVKQNYTGSWSVMRLRCTP